LDLAREPAPIAVYAHALNGGVLIDEKGSSTLPGLLAAGEVAGGPHGADRLGGNMLATCQVFGARAGKYAAMYAREMERPALLPETIEKSGRLLLIARAMDPEGLKSRRAIQDLMFASLVVERNGPQLRRALGLLHSLEPGRTNEEGENSGICGALETQNLLEVARVMTRAALLREESRGSHYRTDFPETNDREWNRSIVSKLEDGALKEYTVRLQEKAGP
jgi:succinate dehydrogenase/fumarate reductase flavoprotein subunit